MNPIKIYLAGSIDGLTYAEATDWRIEFAERLHKLFGDNIVIFDPTERYRYGKYKPDEILDLKDIDGSSIIFNEDINDSSQADIAVINIQGKSKGTGTIFEIGFMYAKRVKLIGYIDPANPLGQHPFINNSVDLYRTMEDMFRAVKNSVFWERQCVLGKAW